MKDLDQHNKDVEEREKQLKDTYLNAGVKCPKCQTVMQFINEAQRNKSDYRAVVCPKCGYEGVKRESRFDRPPCTKPKRFGTIKYVYPQEM